MCDEKWHSETRAVPSRPGRVAPKVRSLMRDAIERGIRMGYNRAFKHIDKPTEELFIEKIDDAVWECLDEAFVIDDPTDD